jgi:NitT/TauT family transport system permease protein
MDLMTQVPGADGSAITKAKRGANAWRGNAVGIVIAGITLLAIWELVSLWRPLFVASPYDSVRLFIQWATDGTLWVNLWVTLQETLIGAGLSLAIGIPVGVLLALVRPIDRATRPYIDIMNTIPRLGLAPLFVLWFGLGMQAKIALAFTSLVFLVVINTYAGIKAVDPELVLLVRLLGGGRRDVIQRVYVPSLVPWFIVTLRLCAAFGVASAVIGEFIAGNMGLGYLLNSNTQVLNTVGEFAALLALILLAAVLTIAIMIYERRALRWRRLSEQ